MKTPRLVPGAPWLAPILLLLLAGCETQPDRKAMMEEARHSVPPMAAEDTFFDGKIVAHLTLGMGGREGASGEGESGGGRHGGGRRGGGGMSMGMGGGGRRGGGTGGGYGGEDSSDSSDSGAMAIAREARHNESMMPAVMLRLRLENKGAGPVTVEVRDLDSELGNFAVQPDTLTIAPGHSEQPDPMQSLLGVDNLNLPVTVTLRVGGKSETRILTLKPVAPPPGAPPAPTPPANGTAPSTPPPAPPPAPPAGN